MSEVADSSLAPNYIYVVSVSTIDNIVYDVRCCSVQMAIAPEVRYVRVDRIAALEQELAEATAALKAARKKD